MYPNNTSYRKTPDAWIAHSLDAMHSCGPNAGQYLEAEERHHASMQLATQTPAHGAHTQAPPKWRQWSGAILVRAGNRLQGVVVPTGTRVTSEPH
jgi:hypothetical protein